MGKKLTGREGTEKKQTGKKRLSQKTKPAVTVQGLSQAMQLTTIEAAKIPSDVKKAMKAQAKRVTDGAVYKRRTMPLWARTLVQQQSSPEEIIHAAVQRAVDKGDKATLIEVKAVLSEFARNSSTAAGVIHTITADTLNKLRK